MRSTLFVLALVLVFAIPISADEAGQLPSALSLNTPSAARVRQFELSPPGMTRQFRMSDPAKIDLRTNDTVTFSFSKPTRLSANQVSPDNTCYRMRTFQVRRVDNTDVTRPSGYSTCLSGGQVKMKSAVGSR